MTNQEIQSKSIDFMRFPLIVGVVYYHNSDINRIAHDFGIENVSDMPLLHTAVDLLSVIPRVPIFFLFAGFLFFINTEFNRETYLQKLKRRVKSLLVPYLFWNLAYLAIQFILSHLPYIQNWFVPREYTPGFILSCLWGIVEDDPQRPMTLPIVYQFWFIRDLMVVVILTPIIHLLVKYTKLYGLGLFCVLWYFEWWPGFMQYHGLRVDAWFFFYAGAYLSINRKNLVETFNKSAVQINVIYPVLALVDLCTKGTSYNVYINNAVILMGIVFLFNLTSHYVGKGNWKMNAVLSGSAFFLFAIHDPWLLMQFRKIAFRMLQPETDGMLTLLYVIIPLLVTIVAVGIYILLRKYWPSLTRIATGQRV